MGKTVWLGPPLQDAVGVARIRLKDLDRNDLEEFLGPIGHLRFAQHPLDLLHQCVQPYQARC
jgi:hypothetical protein